MGTALLAHLNWANILPRLNVQPPTQVLPATVGCPLCAAELLRIYKDITSGGEWHHCFGCGTGGDMLELVCAVWQTSPEEAIFRLRAEGLFIPEDVTTEKSLKAYRTWVDRRRTLHQFYRDSVELTASPPPGVADIQNKLGLRRHITDPRWNSHGRQWLGVGSVKAVRAAAPKAPMANSFDGNGWGDVLITPMYDLPGRIRSLACMGRLGDSSDLVVRRTPTENRDVEDCGLSMLETLFENTPAFPNVGYIILDPFLAVRLQLRHLQSNPLPAPLCGSVPRQAGTNVHLWEHLRFREYVFWGHELNAQLIRQAAAADGKIACHVSLCLAKEWLRNMPTMEWLKRLSAAAEPWQTSLEKLLRDTPEFLLEGIITQLSLPPDQWSRFLADARSDVRDKVKAISGRKEAGVRVGNHRILQTQRGWITANGALICDAPFVIDEVLPPTERQSPLMRGRIQYKGHEIPFSVGTKRFQDNPRQWLYRTVAAAGKGLPIIAHQWGKRLLVISQLFHEPACRVRLTRIGWSSELNGFTLPQFTVVGGAIQEPAGATNKYLPARALARPMPLVREQLFDLSAKTPVTPLFWATTAAILSNILSPVFRREPQSIVLSGRSAQIVGFATAKMHGCDSFSFQNKRTDADMETLCGLAAAHDWPLVVDNVRLQQSRYVQWISSVDGPRNCIYGSDPLSGKALAVNGGTIVIESDAPVTSAQSVQHGGRLIVPLYLQDVSRRRFDLVGGTGFRAVLADLAEWFGSVGGDEAIVKSGGALTRLQEDTGTTIIEFLLEAYLGGRIDYYDFDYRPCFNLSRPTVWYAPDRLYIAVAPLATYLNNMKARVAPDLVQAEAFMGATLLGTTVVDGYSCWVLRRDEWDAGLAVRRQAVRKESAASKFVSGNKIGANR